MNELLKILERKPPKLGGYLAGGKLVETEEEAIKCQKDSNIKLALGLFVSGMGYSGIARDRLSQKLYENRSLLATILLSCGVVGD